MDARDRRQRRGIGEDARGRRMWTAERTLGAMLHLPLAAIGLELSA